MAVETLTFGCRLNAYEAEVMKAEAVKAGLENAVIINTCAVTAEAVKQARQAVRKARRDNPDARIIVTAFIVVVIGGLGNLYGALAGAIAVGVLKALGLLYAPRLSMVLIFLLMAAVLMTRALRRTAD